MKKIYTLVAAFAVAGTINAQTIIDFESYSLAGPETAVSDAGSSNVFNFGDVSFDNFYDTQWGSFTGFAMSNYTDVTTPGWTNQFSSYTGSGFGGSSNYAIYYAAGQISVNAPTKRITRFNITNTTYAYLSMRDGDGYGKQFGSIYDADSIIDGTNGEDFFKVWIIGENFDGSERDSIEFFLADYRFADNTQDYIVSDWNEIDFSNFSFDVSTVNFAFESSDFNLFGPKTPTYLALDNLIFENVGGLSEAFTANFSSYPNPVQNELTIQGGVGIITIFSSTGKLIQQLNHTEMSSINVADLQSGVYFVTLTDAIGSRTKQFVK